MPYFSGRVKTVVYRNDAQSFYILKMQLDKGAEVTVRGNVPGVTMGPGSWFGFEGAWTTHTTYGRQISISRAPVIQGGWDTEKAIKLLVGHGIGQGICSALEKHFGADLVDALSSVERLQEAPAITEFTALHIVSRWQAIRAMFQTLDFLGDLNLPKQRVDQIFSTFGSDAEKVLSEDPWSLVQVEGITFEQSDEVARKLGLDFDPLRRLRGAILYACKKKRGLGHVFLDTSDLLDALQEYAPNIPYADLVKTLKSLRDEGLLVIDNKSRPGTTAIFEPWAHKIESSSAQLLAERMKSAVIEDPEDIAKLIAKLATVGPQTEVQAKSGSSLKEVASAALREWSVLSKMQLSDPQLEGALNAIIHPCSILTGGPGTGKTTCLRVVVKLLQDACIPFLLVAPTGIAAKRLTAVTGAPASTIHRAFQATGDIKDSDREATYAGVVGSGGSDLGGDGSAEDWGYSPTQPHPAQVVICDEASMLDQHLLFRVLTSTSATCRIVFVGDAAQLPSVGPGNVLRDMISTNLLPMVNLKEIFRQDEQNDIVLAAHTIFGGKTPNLNGKDFTFKEIFDETKVLNDLMLTVKRLYDKRQNFQVLSPRHSGTLGVTNLNLQIRELLNPKALGLKEIRLGPETVREGDRVVVSKNNYQFGIFNGDMGKVVALDTKASIIEVKIWGPPEIHIKMPFKDAPFHLRMAYCVTVHKCLHGDTLVETEKGLQRIADIADTGMIGTAQGPKPYQSKVVNPPSAMLRIRTKDGYEVTVTPNHGLDVWDPESGGYIRREAREIRLQDVLRLSMSPGMDVAFPSKLPCPPQARPRSKTYSFPAEMTPETAEFLGLMVGDGTLFQRGCRLAKRHPEVTERFAELAGLLFGVPVKRFFVNGAHHAEVNSVQIADWLREVGGMGPNNKQVPVCVLESPVSLQRHFLRGLFEDGSVHLRTNNPEMVDHIEWSTASEPMAKTVRTMLLRMGIVCGTVPSKPLSNLQIYGSYVAKFAERVGFVSRMKKDRCLLPAGKETGYGFPITRGQIKNLRQTWGDAIPFHAYKNGVNRERMTRHTAELVLSRGLDVSEPNLKALAETLKDFHSPVVAIDPVVAPSYCIEVPDGHQFLQNGFRGWNSQGNEFDIIVMPWVRGFAQQLQRNLLYTAITRARKKVFLVGHADAVEKAVANSKSDTRNTLLAERLLTLLGPKALSGDS